MKTLFDIPAHPLFVHAPIVLLPLLAIVTIVAAVRPSVGVRLGKWLPIAMGVVFVTVLLAMQSGEALYDVVVEEKGSALNAHKDLAETTRLLAFLMLLATVGQWVLNRRLATSAGGTTAGGARRDPKVLAVTVVVVLLAVLSTVWMVRTGHEGARIHWKGVIPEGS